MAKRKPAKRPAVKLRPAKRTLEQVAPVALPPDVVLVPVPIEKTKHTMWQNFVDWLKQ